MFLVVLGFECSTCDFSACGLLLEPFSQLLELLKGGLFQIDFSTLQNSFSWFFFFFNVVLALLPFPTSYSFISVAPVQFHSQQFPLWSFVLQASPVGSFQEFRGLNCCSPLQALPLSPAPNHYWNFCCCSKIGLLHLSSGSVAFWGFSVHVSWLLFLIFPTDTDNM
jgi:hypothetical protein